MHPYRNLPILLLFSLLVICTSQAQTLSPEWAHAAGGSFADQAEGLCIDQSGNVYVTGQFSNTVDFDPDTSQSIFTSMGITDIFLQKWNANGELLWAVSIGGTGFDVGYAVTSNDFGDVFIAGFFSETVDFDPGPGTFNMTSNGSTDAFVLKLDSAGSFVWAQAFGAENLDRVQAIALDQAGNVLLTGTFSATVDFDLGAGTNFITSNGSRDMYTMKLDPAGNYIWATRIGGLMEEFATGIAVDAENNIYRTGYFKGQLDFDPGTGTSMQQSNGQEDYFIIKQDSAGSLEWVHTFGSGGLDAANGISLDSLGNPIITGRFAGSVDADPGIDTSLMTSVTASCFAHKLDTAGNLLWSRGFPGYATGRAIASGPAGNVFLSGEFYGTVDCDPDTGQLLIYPVGGVDMYGITLDFDGNFIWATNAGSTGEDCGFAVGIGPDKSAYMAGFFSQATEFDPGPGSQILTSNGLRDSFTAKYRFCPEISAVDVITSCDSLTWINGVTYYASDSTAQDTLSSMDGCDSILTLHLTIVNESYGTDVITACDSTVWIDGNSYYSSNNTATHTIANARGCDSIVTLDLTINTVSAFVDVVGTTLTAQAVLAEYQWLKCNDDGSYTLLLNDTNQSFTATQSGDYALQVTDQCTDTSECITVTVVGLSGTSLFDGTMVFPNPTQGSINVQLGTLKVAELKLFNTMGQLVQTATVTDRGHQLKIEGAPGVYFLELNSQDITKRFRIVKE